MLLERQTPETTRQVSKRKPNRLLTVVAMLVLLLYVSPLSRAQTKGSFCSQGVDCKGAAETGAVLGAIGGIMAATGVAGISVIAFPIIVVGGAAVIASVLWNHTGS